MPAAGVLGTWAERGGFREIRGKLIIAGGLLIRSCGYSPRLLYVIISTSEMLGIAESCLHRDYSSHAQVVLLRQLHVSTIAGPLCVDPLMCYPG